MLCTMYLYFFVQVSTVNHEWNDDFCAYGRPMGHLFFLLFSYVIFLILCKLFLLYFTLYGIHVHIHVHIFVHTMEACNKDYYYYYYWGRDKMDAISQTTFWSAFSWMKMFEFRLKFHWSLFLRVQLTIFRHWFRWWLGAVQATSHYLNQWWLDYRRIYASFSLNELTQKYVESGVVRCITRYERHEA